MSLKMLMGSVEPQPVPDRAGETRGLGLGLLPPGEYAEPGISSGPLYHERGRGSPDLQKLANARSQ